ncbi:hypothetical protein AB0I28_20280 [Phytomonospora sp. NPDC050363]|uniref:hypothetical protein n=1 Tax=Phytomonospora sp. NPDC050363 TaxID=3155642 RepID=UPI0033C6A090
MSPTLIVILVLVVVVALAAGAWFMFRGKSLRHRFGPEYDRLVGDSGKAEAERELRERIRRHDELELKDLTPEQRERYIGRWRALQIHFVDQPDEAVREADALTTALAGEIGYPTDNDEERLAVLSVDHPRSMADYREAHALSTSLHDGGEASTEQLRRAMVHYRAIVTRLLGKEAQIDEPTPRSSNA